MAVNAPLTLDLAKDSVGNTHPVLAYKDANGAYAHVMSHWYISPSNILLPAPMNANGMPQSILSDGTTDLAINADGSLHTELEASAPTKIATYAYGGFTGGTTYTATISAALQRNAQHRAISVLNTTGQALTSVAFVAADSILATGGGAPTQAFQLISDTAGIAASGYKTYTAGISGQTLAGPFDSLFVLLLFATTPTTGEVDIYLAESY